MSNIVRSRQQPKVILRKLCALLLRLFFSATLGLVLLFAVYALPVDPIEAHMEQSAKVINAEAEQYISDYYIMTRWATSQQDNYMDSLMLLESADATGDSIINKALLVYRGGINSINPDYVLIDHYVKGIPFSGSADYPRYWHGYLLFMKPLLSLVNYGTIRTMNSIIQFILLLSICFILYKKDMKEYIIPYIISYLMLMPVTMARSLSYSACYYIWSVGIIIMLSMSELLLEKKKLYIFLYIGIALAYFDYLTFPIATFGVPALFYVALRKQDSMKKRLLDIVGNGLAWGIGYGGMWLSKWLIASLITGKNVIADGLGQFIYRTGGDLKTEQWSILTCLIRNYKAFVKTPASILLIILLIYLGYLLVKHKNKIKKEDVISFIPYGLLLIIPVAWYIIALNHSSIHTWFTNKACIVSILALAFIMTEMIHKLQDTEKTPNQTNCKGYDHEYKQTKNCSGGSNL